LTSANPLKARLQKGEVVMGAWSIIDSPIHCEILLSNGFDFLILDLEHGVFSQPTLESCIRACESAGGSPLVRVPGLNAGLVQNALDFGAHGIVFPQVAGAIEVASAMRMTQYPPNGVRGFNPFTRAGNYGSAAMSRPKIENGFCLNSIIVENLRSYEELDQILKLPDLDLVYLGVYDMSVALGAKGDMKNPKLIQFVEDCIPRVRKAGKAVGVMVHDPIAMKSMIEKGANFIVYAVDTFLLTTAAMEARKTLIAAQGKSK